MDLVYANNKNEELGVLKAYTFDLAYGIDENNFSLTMPLTDHCMGQGYLVYVDGTEYGGVVDSITADNKANTVIYSGRTWHGILANAVIVPPSGFDYYIAQGDAHAILAQLVQDLGLENIFEVASGESEIDIAEYQFARYVNAYAGICEMLAQNDGKLLFEHRNDKVILSAVPLIDYSVNEEWDSSQLGFNMTRNYRPVNHLICLGQGDLAERAVIHLFTDEYGAVQGYYSEFCPMLVDENEELTPAPTNNEHYNLTTSQQVLFGVDEVAEVYDYPSAEITANYVMMETQPSDWATNYEDYYYLDGDMYDNAFATEETKYTALTAKPSDWDKNYARYFYVDENGDYSTVEATIADEPKRTEITKKPSDWAKNYGEYVYFYSDGVTTEYRRVDGDTKYTYTAQTAKPSDWEDNASSYFQKKKNGGYKAVPVKEKFAVTKSQPSGWASKYDDYYVKYSDGTETMYKSANGIQKTRYHVQTQKPTNWKKGFKSYYKKKGTKYVKLSGKTAPAWKASTYYTQERYQVAPEWKASKYYEKTERGKVPKWEAKKYFTRSSEKVAPDFDKLIKDGEKIYYETENKIVPTWATNTYYSESTVLVKPSWTPNTYYDLEYDYFKELVDAGLEKLKDSWNCDDINLNMYNRDNEYDIGDIVGANDNVTGIMLWQPVTKKIVTIQKGRAVISYEIGGK